MITNAKQPATGTKAAKQTLVVRQNHQQIPSATSGSGSTSVAATTEGMQSMADAFHALSSVIAGLQPAAASNDGDEQDRLQRTEQASGDASNERKPYEVTRRVEQKLAPVPLPKAPQNEMTAVATAIRNLTTMVARMQPDPVASVQRVRGHGQQRGVRRGVKRAHAPSSNGGDSPDESSNEDSDGAGPLSDDDNRNESSSDAGDGDASSSDGKETTVTAAMTATMTDDVEGRDDTNVVSEVVDATNEQDDGACGTWSYLPSLHPQRCRCPRGSIE